MNFVGIAIGCITAGGLWWLSVVLRPRMRWVRIVLCLVVMLTGSALRVQGIPCVVIGIVETLFWPIVPIVTMDEFRGNARAADGFADDNKDYSRPEALGFFVGSVMAAQGWAIWRLCLRKAR